MNHIGFAVIEEARVVALCRSSYRRKREGAARCAAVIEECTGVYVTPELWPSSCEEEVAEYAELLCRDLGPEEWSIIEIEAAPGAAAAERNARLEHEAAAAAEAITASRALALLAACGITAGVNSAGTLWINAPADWRAPEALAAARWSAKRDQWWLKVPLDTAPSKKCTRVNLSHRAKAQAA